VNRVLSREVSRYALAGLSGNQTIRAGNFAFVFSGNRTLKKLGLALVATSTKFTVNRARKSGKYITTKTRTSRSYLSQGIRRIPSSFGVGRNLGKYRFKQPNLARVKGVRKAFI